MLWTIYVVATKCSMVYEYGLLVHARANTKRHGNSPFFANLRNPVFAGLL